MDVRHRIRRFLVVRQQGLLIMRVAGLLSGLGKHLDSRVDVIGTFLPYTRAALRGHAGPRAGAGIRDA